MRHGFPVITARLLLLILAALLAGCSSKQSVQFKINSEPEGAHVVYRVSGVDGPTRGEWIYLGHTPIRVVRQLDEETVTDADTITLKVMRAGYFDQVREVGWRGLLGRGCRQGNHLLDPAVGSAASGPIANAGQRQSLSLHLAGR